MSQIFPKKLTNRIFDKFLPQYLTSLNIFEHYKLKPNFPIIKDKKTKDMAWVGDKPPPPKFW